ncbi:ornithine cyclodeaminase family protein [Nocardia sp. NPDC051981]|uniref:ornithine cyclodeaminase family protein n=1 Tax=Nocardia sp. NPDC051981 TaxID=3155417 RepID=UPI0034459DC4
MVGVGGLINLDTLVLTQEHIGRLLEVIGPHEVMCRVIDRLEYGMTELGLGRRRNSPPRSGFLRATPGDGVIENMPHYEPGHDMTLKNISYIPHNRERFALPTVLGSLYRVSGDTGVLTAVADAQLITAMRTGAASAIASKILARVNSSTVGIVGAGAQSVTQLHGISTVYGIENVLVFDIDAANAESFADRVAFLGLHVEVATLFEIMTHADIICTATSVPVGEGPVLPDVSHLPHLHINTIGSDEAGKTELPVGLLRRAFVCVDHLEQALAEGDSQQLVSNQIGASLPELCAAPQLAKQVRDGLTVFDSTGFAFEDHLALDVFLEMAQELGLGEKLPIMNYSGDLLNPYSSIIDCGMS